MLSQNLLQILRSIPKSYFSLSDIKKFYNGNEKSLRILLTRFSKKGVLQRIMRGYYTFDMYQVDFEEFATTVKKPSYISLESALYYHGLIDQIPESITLVTTGKSQMLMCEGKTLEYSHIKEELYFGYELQKNTLLAVKEKALLDELYYISLKKRTLTIDPNWFSKLNQSLFRKWLDRYPTYVKKLYYENAWMESPRNG